MPIRFRCAYCNQLMGIARRKAGTVVRCPTCSGQVVVPNPDAEGTERPPPPQSPALFEQSDFDQMLGEPAANSPTVIPDSPLPVGAWGTHAEPAYDVERIDPVPGAPQVALMPMQQGGIVLSPSRATMITVVGILLIALAFGAGVLVGKFAL